MQYKVGDSVDVLDTADSVWCPATILSVMGNKRYLITYVGWGDEFDEVIADSASRLAVGGTHVTRAKAWVRLGQSIPWWPCQLYIRKAEGELGIENLREEKKVFVVPCGDNVMPIKPYFQGTWKNTKYVSPFAHRRQSRCINGQAEPKSSVNFVKSLEELQTSGAVDFDFKFDGSFECSDLISTQPSVSKKRDITGETQSDLLINQAKSIVAKDNSLTPQLRAIQSKSHFIQAIRHNFEDDVYGITSSSVELNFNLHDRFATQLCQLPNALSCSKKPRTRKSSTVVRMR